MMQNLFAKHLGLGSTIRVVTKMSAARSHQGAHLCGRDGDGWHDVEAAKRGTSSSSRPDRELVTDLQPAIIDVKAKSA